MTNSTQLGAGMRIVGDYDLPKCGLWSIRTTIAAEVRCYNNIVLVLFWADSRGQYVAQPFVEISVAIGASQSWTSRYEYYTV
jgi:hypothetical protein